MYYPAMVKQYLRRPRLSHIGKSIFTNAIHVGSKVSLPGIEIKVRMNNKSNKKLSYRREIARQLHTPFSAHSLIVHFTEHRICFTTI